MTLKTARNIELAFDVVTFLIVLPVLAAAVVVSLIDKPLSWILDERNRIGLSVGNRLMRMSDAVKEGSIRNPRCLKTWTAITAWRYMEEEKRNGGDAEVWHRSCRLPARLPQARRGARHHKVRVPHDKQGALEEALAHLRPRDRHRHLLQQVRQEAREEEKTEMEVLTCHHL